MTQTQTYRSTDDDDRPRIVTNTRQLIKSLIS